MFFHRVLTSVLLPLAFAAPALAQEPPALPGNYPNKPVKITTGGIGSGTDIVARALAQKLSENWGRQFIVENHASGLGSIIAMEVTAKAPPDGYTLHLAPSSAYMNAALVTKVSYNIRTALAPIAMLNQQPYVLMVGSAVPARNLKELIAYAKSKNGALNYGSSGTGTASHLGMELLKNMAGVDMQHIPYKGSSQGYVDLHGGRIQLLFSGALSAMPQAKAGKARAMGAGSLKRTRLLPDVPTINESGLPGFELIGWHGLIGTGGMPTPIIAALNKESVQIMNSADMQAKLAADGAEAAEPQTPAQFAKAINDEIDRWARVIKASNLTFEN
jgi:tripartite-type tricarboxylate transporter receptor subunit TctC